MAFVRGRTRIRRVGHTGTLDPAATGVLPLCLGQATRLSQYLTDADKIYVADIELGVETDTYDADGTVLQREDASRVGRADVDMALRQFTGEFDQVPPLYSAIKRQGVAAYKLARRGESVDLPARRVRVHRIAVLAYEAPHLKLEIDCAKGFYVRSLAHDLGRVLGVGGSLTGLVRSRAGSFRLDDAVDIETLRAELETDAWRERLFAPDEVLLHWQALLVGEDNETRLRSGRSALVTETGDPGSRSTCRAYGRDGSLVAILRREAAGVWQPEKVFDLR